MVKLHYLKQSEAWQPDADTISSFDGGYDPCRLHGPVRLVRLVTSGGIAPEGQTYRANNPQGSFWLAERDFLRLRNLAEADLRQQQGSGNFRNTFSDLVGLYMRHQLRDLLAVRRDWTPSFDGYMVLSIPRSCSAVALVGRVRQQPVYSPTFDGHATAQKAGIRLAGGLTQYVIDFQFPANRQLTTLVTGPLSL
jgi:hypothetical protein